MKKTSLLLTLFMLMCFSMTKAETVLVGDGSTTSTSGLPSAVNWNYSMSQQIYTVEEIGKTGTITSIAFKPVKGPAQARTLKVYLVETPKSSFSSTNDWVPFSERDVVFGGSVDLVNGEWATLPIGWRFNYSGTGNLCVITIDETGSFIQNTSVDWLAYRASNQSNYRYNDYSPYSPSSLTFSETGNLKNYKNQIQLTFEDTETVEVGRDDFSLHLLPTNSDSEYSLTQQIYTKEEIGKNGIISSIAFYNADPSVDAIRDIELYLVQTNQTSFGGGKWIPISTGDRVFRGNVTFKHGCWTTIYFNMPFYYDGMSNLAVVMDDNTGSAQSHIEFSVYNTNKQYQSIYACFNYTDYDPENPPSKDWTCSYAKNCIQLGFMSGSGFDPGLVQIGDGGTTQKSGLPSATSWKYSLSEQIYTVAEVRRSGVITSIAFKSCEFTLTRTIDLYLVHTDKSSYSSGTDWVTGSESDKVFSGTVTFEKGEWAIITFDRPFVYDGKRNLCVIVNDKSNVVNSSTQWLVYDATNQAHVRFNDNNPYDPSSPLSTATAINSLRDYKNQIQLGFEDLETVEIGEGEERFNLPIVTSRKCSYSQQIYTQDEIGRAGTIASISFYNDRTDETNRYIYIFLTHTSKNYIINGEKVEVSSGDRVFNGRVTFKEPGWTTIYFDTPFFYDGKNNLAVTVTDQTGSIASNEPLYFRVFSSNPNYCQACLAWSDSHSYNPYDPATISTGSSEQKNCIQLGFIGDSGSDPDPGLVTKTVQIGNAQKSDYDLPVNTFYNYSLTQQIYTAAEIGTEGTITAIAFDYAHSQKLSMSGVKMYMKAVSKSKFDSRSDMVSVGASDQVWEGTLSASEAGWMTITLDKPFKYDGKSNLLVCLYDPTNGYPGSEYTFRYTDTEETRTLAYWSDSNAPDLGSLTSFSGGAGLKTYRSNIKLSIQTSGSGPGLDFIDFETGDFSQFRFQNDSDYPWIVTSTDASDGTYCMKSGNAGVASSSSFITATRTYEEDGYVCFDAKCMGEGTAWDVCSFYIDGEVQFSYGALGNYWAFYYYPVTAGSHTFKWEYKKDNTTNPEGDGFFVDNIRFLQEGRDDDIIVGVSSLGETEEGAAIYNLAGQRLAKMQKGINITNGRKILVK